MLFNRDERLRFMVKEFAHSNPELLIIVADPKTDRIFTTYKDKFVNGTIKQTDGKKSHIIREVLKLSRFNTNVDSFLVAVMETLNVPLWKPGTSQFFHFLDGAVYNIGRSLQKKKGPALSKPELAGAVKSPLQADAGGRVGGKI